MIRSILTSLALCCFVLALAPAPGCSTGSAGGGGGGSEPPPPPPPAGESVDDLVDLDAVLNLGTGQSDSATVEAAISVESTGLAPDSAAVELNPRDIQASGFNQAGICTAEVTVSVAQAGAPEACQSGLPVGTFEVTIVDGMVTAVSGSLTLDGQALALVMSGQFSVCLTGESDCEGTIEIDQLIFYFFEGQVTELEGTWIGYVPSDNICGVGEDFMMILRGDKYEAYYCSGQWQRGSFTVNSSQNPKWLDATIEASSQQEAVGATVREVYELSGNTLRIAVQDNAGSGQRPASVEPSNDVFVAMFTKVGTPRTELEGVWVTQDSDEPSQNTTVIFNGTGYDAFLPGGEWQQGTFTNNTSTTPSQLDLTIDKASQALSLGMTPPVTLPAIYELSGEALRLAASQGDSFGVRPTVFEQTDTVFVMQFTRAGTGGGDPDESDDHDDDDVDQTAAGCNELGAFCGSDGPCCEGDCIDGTCQTHDEIAENSNGAGEPDDHDDGDNGNQADQDGDDEADPDDDFGDDDSGDVENDNGGEDTDSCTDATCEEGEECDPATGACVSTGVGAGDAAAGQVTYETSCTVCHGDPGAGEGVGPDLAGAGAQLEDTLTGDDHGGGSVDTLGLTAQDLANLAAYLAAAGAEPGPEPD